MSSLTLSPPASRVSSFAPKRDRIRRAGTETSALRSRPTAKDAAWIVIDFYLAGFAVFAGYALAPQGTLGRAAVDPVYLHPVWHALGFAVGMLVFTRALGLRPVGSPRPPSAELWRTGAAVGLASGTVTLLGHGLFFDLPARDVLAFSAVTTIPLFFGAGVVARRTGPLAEPRVCFIGEPVFCDVVRRYLREGGSRTTQATLLPVLGDLGEDDRPAVHENGGHPAVVAARRAPGGLTLEAWLEAGEFDEVVVPFRLAPSILTSVLACPKTEYRLLSFPDFMERREGCVPIDHIDSRWILSGAWEGAPLAYRAAKRCCDIVLGGAGLLLTAPLIALSAVAIQVSSPGPVFDSDIRIGRNGKPFRSYRLRCRRAKTGDAGIGAATAVGRALRRWRIDRLPRLWNLLCGDLSLVGPSADTPDRARVLTGRYPFYHKRNLMRPGLTGWAQIHEAVSGGMDCDQRRLAYDLYYVRTASPELDFQVLIRTAAILLFQPR